jgi:lipopolysaccharide transport system ATP-binding protein
VSGIAIQATGLGKRYRIGQRSQQRSLREHLTDLLAAPARRLMASVRSRGSAVEDETVWALRDTSFEVRPGEVLGIIGSNGAGKTTLLKILSRITEPTEGQARLHGRVGSLLEVGTGFHPELTGRENLFLNGAILGMKRSEIARKFDQIVAFADIDRFIDTPVKRYSSGMYVRLAFAVAAHLEPEILLVDEVLAVGDAAFQRKCLGKMGDVARGGRTVLLVSHNMGAIRQLCRRCLWIEKGRIRQDGAAGAVVDAYLAASDASGETGLATFAASPEKSSQLRGAQLLNAKGEPCTRFTCDEPVVVELLYEVRRALNGLYGCFQVSRDDGTAVMLSYSHDLVPNPLDGLGEGWHTLRITIPARSLGRGQYRIQFSTARGVVGDTSVDDAGTIASFALDDVTTLQGNLRIGYFSTLLDWQIESGRPR